MPSLCGGGESNVEASRGMGSSGGGHGGHGDGGGGRGGAGAIALFGQGQEEPSNARTGRSHPGFQMRN